MISEGFLNLNLNPLFNFPAAAGELDRPPGLMGKQLRDSHSTITACSLTPVLQCWWNLLESRSTTFWGWMNKLFPEVDEQRSRSRLVETRWWGGSCGLHLTHLGLWRHPEVSHLHTLLLYTSMKIRRSQWPGRLWERPGETWKHLNSFANLHRHFWIHLCLLCHKFRSYVYVLIRALLYAASLRRLIRLDWLCGKLNK